MSTTEPVLHQAEDNEHTTVKKRLTKAEKKKAKIEAQRAYRKEHRKEKRKARQQRKTAAAAAAEGANHKREREESDPGVRKKQVVNDRLVAAMNGGQRIVVDCDWDSEMKDAVCWDL